MNHKPCRRSRKAQEDTNLGAVSFKGCGLAHDRCGQAGSARGSGPPRRASRTLEYRCRWFPVAAATQTAGNDRYEDAKVKNEALSIYLFSANGPTTRPMNLPPGASGVRPDRGRPGDVCSLPKWSEQNSHSTEGGHAVRTAVAGRPLLTMVTCTRLY